MTAGIKTAFDRPCARWKRAPSGEWRMIGNRRVQDAQGYVENFFKMPTLLAPGPNGGMCVVDRERSLVRRGQLGSYNLRAGGGARGRGGPPPDRRPLRPPRHEAGQKCDGTKRSDCQLPLVRSAHAAPSAQTPKRLLWPKKLQWAAPDPPPPQPDVHLEGYISTDTPLRSVPTPPPPPPRRTCAKRRET